MAEKKQVNQTVSPAFITDTETGKRYELDFNRDAVKFMERQGFNLNNIDSQTKTVVEDLFYYSFRMHHKNEVSREKADKLREKWGGLPNKLVTRLVELFLQAQQSNTIQTGDEGDEKNALVTLELPD